MSDVTFVNRPVVAKAPRQTSATGFAIGLAVFGLLIFFWLSAARAEQDEQGTSLPPLSASSAPPPAPLAPVGQAQPMAQPVAPLIPNSGPVTLIASQSGYAPPPVAGFAPAPPVDPMRERARAPTLVVDLAQADVPRQPGSPGAVRSDSGIDPRDQPSPAADRNLSDTERFSARVGGEEVEVAQARRMAGLDRLVPQGAIVGAVMETALNSDLPGFARAIVQRDVYSFDGSAVLDSRRQPIDRTI